MEKYNLSDRLYQPAQNYRIRMLCTTREDRAPGRNWELCRDKEPAGVQVVLLGLVDDPEVPSALCFRVWQCHVDFQPLEGTLIAPIAETNE
jgi:hypothetical protein